MCAAFIVYELFSCFFAEKIKNRRLFKLDKIYFFNPLDIFYVLSYHKQALNIAG